MDQVRSFVAGVGALAPFARVGRLVTIGLCLLVGVRSLAAVVRNAEALFLQRDVILRDALLSLAVLGCCLLVVAGLFAVIVRAGELRRREGAVPLTSGPTARR